MNDIITFRESGVPVTHRLIKITPTGYITQGDANNTADGETTFDKIEGKVILIVPKMGLVIDFLKSPFGILMLVTIGLL